MDRAVGREVEDKVAGDTLIHTRATSARPKRLVESACPRVVSQRVTGRFDVSRVRRVAIPP